MFVHTLFEQGQPKYSTRTGRPVISKTENRQRKIQGRLVVGVVAVGGFCQGEYQPFLCL